jgi:uncharacterized protein (TIGR02145 family)
MSENLKTSRYRNGGSIPYVVGDDNWRWQTIGAWSYYNHDPANNAVYGKLYNWYTTLGDTLCPTGWGVPTSAEWTFLISYLGGESVAGGKMKTIGTTYWLDPNTGASNESGFSAFPGGDRRGDSGGFEYISYFAHFWSATVNYNGNAWYLDLDFRFGSAPSRSGGSISSTYNKSFGASIRCLRD